MENIFSNIFKKIELQKFFKKIKDGNIDYNKRLLSAKTLEETQDAINHHADVNVQDKDGKTALMYASDYSQMKFLLDHGADVNIQDKDGKTALMYESASDQGGYSMMCPRNYSQMQSLLDHGADVNAQDKDGKTALMYASKCPQMRFLLDHGADANIQDKDGKTALMYVMDRYPGNESEEEECKNLIEMLYFSGADLDAKDKEGKPALMHAWTFFQQEQLLSWGANVNVQDSDGKTLLMNTWSGNVRTLIEKYGAQLDIVDNDGMTALMHAVAKEDAGKFVYLLKAGADTNIADNNGETALIKAAFHPSTSSWHCSRLLEAGANPNAADKNGVTALMNARDSDYIADLIKAGADVNAKDKNGNTALMHIMKRERDYCEENRDDSCYNYYIESWQEQIKPLLEAGADIDAVNNKGKVAGDYVVPELDESLLRVLSLHKRKQSLWQERINRAKQGARNISGAVVADVIAEKVISCEKKRTVTPQIDKKLRAKFMLERAGNSK